MNPVDEFEAQLRQAIQDVGRNAEPAPDLSTRLIANSPADSGGVVSLRRRRVWLAPFVAAAVVAAIAATIATVSATRTSRPGQRGTPGVSKTGVTPTNSTPAPGRSTAPSRSPVRTSARTTTDETTPPAASIHAVPVSITAVANGTWTVPSWGSGLGCASGAYTFRSGTVTWQHGDTSKPNGGPPYTSTFDIIGGPGTYSTEDVNGDGVTDLVLVLECNGHQPIARAVIALTRQRNGSITTIGSVVSLPSPAVDGRGEIYRLDPGSNGVVKVTMTDTYAGIGTPAYQVRSYRLIGGQFHQVTGPTTFPAR